MDFPVALRFFLWTYWDLCYKEFDIANYFNEMIFKYDTAEHPNYKVDESKFSSDRELLDFCKYYLFFTKYDEENYYLHSIPRNDGYRDKHISKNKILNHLIKKLKKS